MLIPSFSRSTHSPSERKRMKGSERKRKREKNMTNASDFPFHCFPIINFAARVWIPTDCNTRKQRKEWHERKEPNRKKNSTFADLISPSFPRSLCSRFSGYLCGRFQVLFHFSAHTQRKANIWETELYRFESLRKWAKLSQQQGNDKFTNTWPEFYDESSHWHVQTCWHEN